MIDPPVITFVSKTADSVTIDHEPPTVFTPPSTGYSKSIIYLEDNRGNEASQEVDANTSVTITDLDSERTWTIRAVALSDQDELSVLSDPIVVELTSFPVTGSLEDSFPDAYDYDRPVESITEVFITFLEAIAFRVPSADRSSTEILTAGKNAFADYLPKWYSEDDGSYQENPGDIWVLAQNEPLVMPSRNHSKNQKEDSIIRLQVSGGNRDLVAEVSERLYRFFLRRENVVQFEGCSLSVRSVIPTERPSLAGVDEANRVVYAFRLQVKALILNP